MSFFEDKDVRVYSLADWLDNSGGKSDAIFVALSMIQRGSVWQPHQIIDLWDSLLRGMPIGCMMVSELQEGTSVRRPGPEKTRRERVSSRGGLGIVDGQQRILAMLLAWPLADGVKMDQRVWVDFADEPAPGHMLRLRVTTRNQPFGFQRNEPSRKLSLDDRRKAREAFLALIGKQEPDLDTAVPFSYSPGLPIDLRELIVLWREKNGGESWRQEVIDRLKGLEGAIFDRQGAEWKKVRVWEQLKEDKQAGVRGRVNDLLAGLERLFRLEIPLVCVPDRFFETESTKDSDPPLAILFKRIGTGGTPLSDADYVYSVIKHLRPETYDLVNTLHQEPNMARLLTATDLVMSAVRLAAVNWKPENKPVPDMENPSKQDFHRLLQRGEFIRGQFLPLIEGEQARIAHYFNEIHTMLHYMSGSDIGLPNQAFPLLKRPLVQVLLRLAQVGYLNNGEDKARRKDVLRLVLFWLIAVTDPSKASRLALHVPR